MASSFAAGPPQEPHRRRRVELLRRHPRIRALEGYDVRTAWVTVGLVAVQLGSAVLLETLTGQSPVAFRTLACALASLAWGAIVSHWLSMAIHEATHDLALPTRRQNVLLGFFANVPLVAPVAMVFRRYHLAHHAKLGTLGEDTDLPHPLEVWLVGNRTWLKAVWWAGYAFVYVARGATFARRPGALEWLNLAQMVAVDAALLVFVGPTGLLYLTLSLIFAHGLHPVAAHFLHEHYTFAPGQETYSYYGPLNHVTFNVGYHVEHHDFMNVPGWRLPALHALAKEAYAPLVSHRSWTAVLWRFITDPSLGFASRIVRGPQGVA